MTTMFQERTRILTLDHADLRVVQPFDVEVMRDGAMVGLWHPTLEVIGVGPDMTTAAHAFQAAIVE